MDKQFIFYTVNLIAILPALIIASILFKRKPPFAILVANGLICTILGTCITVLMIILRNRGVHHLFTDGYTLFFIRLGILGDMIFYLAAILKKWHFQEKQLTVEKLKSELEVEKMRNRISAELHDDFGSTLSGISMYSHMIDGFLQSGKQDEVKQSVDVIRRSADEMTKTLSDLVWVMNPGRDRLLNLIERLEEYAVTMAAIRNMQAQVSIAETIKDIHLPVDTRRNVYLFCKEAINNAVKYSNGTILELIVKENNDKLEFTVRDNGKGFDAALVKRGNGLENMQKRADEIGARLILQSKLNEGAFLSLQCKITH